MTRPVGRRLLLALGFAALTVAILVAWNAPAMRYELSIYRATPLAVWIGVGFAFLVSVVVCVLDPRDRACGYGLFLGGFSTIVVVSLPALRHYRYYGATDAMTHLGWAEEVRTGALIPTELLYPGGHVLSSIVAEVFGVSTMRAVLLVTAGLVALYVLFIPLTARAIVPDGAVVAIAAFGGFFLLHINNVSTGLTFHAYSFALAGFPVVLFVLVKNVVSSVSVDEESRRPVSWHVVIVLAGMLTLFLHPQVMLNVVLLLGSFVGVHFFARRFLTDNPLAQHRPGYWAFIVLSVIWFAWTIQHWQLQAAAENLFTSVYNTIMGEESPGQAAIDTGVSAEAIGASLTELFIKLFTVSLVYSIAALLAVIGAIVAVRRARRHSAHSVVTYFGCSGLVLGPFFALHWLGDISVYFFRHLGFAMVLATIIGAIGIQVVVERLGERRMQPAFTTVAIMLAVLALTLSMLIVFPSPYIYSPSGHITDQETAGYQTAFATAEDEIRWSGIRTGPHRFHDGLIMEDTPGRLGGASAYEADDLHGLLAGNHDEDLYLPISERDYQREVDAYKELRFRTGDLQALSTSPTTNKVHTNGGFDLFFIRSGG